MKIKHYILTILLCLVAGTGFAQEEKWGMNNPYMDETPWHFGGQVGFVFPSFGLKESSLPVSYWNTQGEYKKDTMHIGVERPGIGFRINGVIEYKLCKYLSLRFSPGLEWHSVTVTYRPYSGDTIGIPVRTGFADASKQTLTRVPLNLPLLFKFSSEREGNFRPYVIAGGGVNLNIGFVFDFQQSVRFRLEDYYCEVGFGVDLYLLWCKLSPEITYRIGFKHDQINRNYTYTQDTGDKEKDDEINQKYTDNHTRYSVPIGEVMNQSISLTFYFGN